MRVLRPAVFAPRRRFVRRAAGKHPLLLIFALAAILAASSIAALAIGPAVGSEIEPAKAPHGAEIVQDGTYPEFRVDGRPFFIHSAAFPYYRIPRDQWQPTLERFQRLGINTIDIYIPWNWHEPSEGQFDYEGRTNPRRDLRGLLALISGMGLKLIAMPGPGIDDRWRHAGYPDWLLARPAYNMDHLDWLEGRYPPLDALESTDADAAASGWLAIPGHMPAVGAWFAAVARELAPYQSTRVVRVAAADPNDPPHDAGGPLLFIQLGDDLASGSPSRLGPDFWRYAGQLRNMLTAAGLETPVFLNSADMPVPSAGSPFAQPIGLTGDWYLRLLADSGPRVPALSARDESGLQFEADDLAAQPNFPPLVMQFQAGAYAPADDDRPPESVSENTLLASRLLLAGGTHGLNYFPLQDSTTPAGYSVPWANRSDRWDAAYSPGGDEQPRVQAVERNTELINALGPELASSHKRADFGIVNPLAAFPQGSLRSGDVARVSQSLMRLERLADLTLLSDEFLDPQHQPVEQLLRDPVLLLPVFGSSEPQFQISDAAQRALVDYVQRGGTLIEFPQRPSGKILETLWQSGSASNEKNGQGQVIQYPRDLASWISLDDTLEENRSSADAPSAMRALREFLSDAGVAPSVTMTDQDQRAGDLIVSELVGNDGTQPLGDRRSGQGFLSVTNLGNSLDDAVFQALSPDAGSRAGHPAYISVHAIVPPRDSLMLPLEIPICAAGLSDAPCRDQVRSAGAELIGAQHNGKDVELSFYTPSRAEVHLRLDGQATHVAIEDTKPETVWTQADHDLEIVVPRGPSPDFIQTIALRLPHVPRAPETEKSKRAKKQLLPQDLRYVVENAVRFPVSENAFLTTYPPLIVPDADDKLTVLMSIENHNTYSSREVYLTLSKPLRGERDTIALPRSSTSTEIDLPGSDQDRASLPVSPDGLFHATVNLRSARDQQDLPLFFLLHRKGTVDHYRFDFDRDGMDEWVLESDRLRLIVSPESGGRIMALMDKVSGADLSTSVGLLRDSFSLNDAAAARTATHRGSLFGLFNRPYSPEWTVPKEPKDGPSLTLRYDAADALPAGATIEKTIRFDGPDTVRVGYTVTPHSSTTSVGSPSPSAPQSFVVLNSFPARSDLGLRTRYCWADGQSTVAPSTPAGDAEKTAADEAGLRCEDFTPGGAPIALPDGIKAVQVRTPGDPVIAIEWDCAEKCAAMTIEPKNFSALFHLQFPPLVPSVKSTYSIRIRAQNAPAQ